ncbi:HAMP domain-containing protein, partial [Tistrella sp.]
MKRLTIPRPTLQVQIIAVVLAGLFLFDTLEPALDRWVGQSAVRPDLKQAVERVRTLADLVGHAPPEGRAAVLEMAGRAGWRLDLAARARAADLAAGAPDDGMLDRLGARLLVPDDVLAPVGGWRTFLDGRRVMAVEVDDRTLLIADFASPQMQLREVTGPLPNYLLALVILCLLFAVFSGRVITRPLRRIATAAAEADLSGEAEIFEERGSTEIVTLARALNRM